MGLCVLCGSQGSFSFQPERPRPPCLWELPAWPVCPTPPGRPTVWGGTLTNTSRSWGQLRSPWPGGHHSCHRPRPYPSSHTTCPDHPGFCKPGSRVGALTGSLPSAPLSLALGDLGFETPNFQQETPPPPPPSPSYCPTWAPPVADQLRGKS